MILSIHGKWEELLRSNEIYVFTRTMAYGIVVGQAVEAFFT